MEVLEYNWFGSVRLSAARTLLPPNSSRLNEFQ